jgi:hypothetical protein
MEDVEGVVTINEAKFNYFEALGGEMRYCEISKEMSPLYFELDVFCLFEAVVPEFYTQPLLPNSCGLYTVE